VRLALANLTDGGRTATIESKTNFISAAPVGSRIVGETMPLHRGRRTMVWQTRVTTADGKLIAIVTRRSLFSGTTDTLIGLPARIYHVPGQRYYDKTLINLSKGERWFCTEPYCGGFKPERLPTEA
jgi:hypothetical protein